MTMSPSLRQFLFFTLCFGGAGLGIFQGCEISIGTVDCSVCESDPACHNHVGPNDQCLCDVGYTRESPSDESNLRCERIPSKGGDNACNEDNTVFLEPDQCICRAGYDWCNPDDIDDLTCCLDNTQAGGETDPGDDAASDSDTGSSESGSMLPPPEPPDDSLCTPEVEGGLFCSNEDPDVIEGTLLWKCVSGAWIEDDETGQSECEFLGEDFSYGCVAEPGVEEVTFFCGSGPGTDCTDADTTCSDGDLLHSCQYGKLTEVSCTAICRGEEESELTEFTEFGECVEGGCTCCDELVDGVCPAE